MHTRLCPCSLVYEQVRRSLLVSYITRRIHVYRPHIFGSWALKLSLYFIGRAYKSKASASQILEALHAPIHGCDVQNADNLSIYQHVPGPLVRKYIRARTAYLDCLSRWNKIPFALRIIISQMAYLWGKLCIFILLLQALRCFSLHALYVPLSLGIDVHRRWSYSATHRDIFGNELIILVVLNSLSFIIREYM